MLYVIGLVVIVFVLWLALVAVLIATPFIIAAAVFAFRSCQELPPPLPDPESFDQPEARKKLLELVRELLPLRQREDEIAKEAKNLSIGITNAGRYDQRKKDGRSFNEELDAINSRSGSLETKFFSIRLSVFSTLPNFRAEFDDWLARRTTLLAAIASAKMYAVGFCVGLLASPLLGEAILQIAIRSWPAWLASATFVGSVCAISAFFLVRNAKRNELAAELNDDKNRRWFELIEFWNPDDETALEEHVAAVSAGRDHESCTDSERTTNGWKEMLGVTDDASIEEIKAAWKTRMKEYHPDRVQTLGPKLKELAEAETKRLNEAYQAALKLRGVA